MDMGAGSMSIWSWLHIDMELAPYQFEAGSISLWRYIPDYAKLDSNEAALTSPPLPVAFMMSSVFRQICAACCSAAATLTSGSEPEVKVVKLLVLL